MRDKISFITIDVPGMEAVSGRRAELIVEWFREQVPQHWKLPACRLEAEACDMHAAPHMLYCMHDKMFR